VVFDLVAERLSDGSFVFNVKVYHESGRFIDSIHFIDEQSARNFMSVLHHGATGRVTLFENGEEYAF
jgi:hypothetical protein